MPAEVVERCAAKVVVGLLRIIEFNDGRRVVEDDNLGHWSGLCCPITYFEKAVDTRLPAPIIYASMIFLEALHRVKLLSRCWLSILIRPEKVLLDLDYSFHRCLIFDLEYHLVRMLTFFSFLLELLLHAAVEI